MIYLRLSLKCESQFCLFLSLKLFGPNPMNGKLKSENVHRWAMDEKVVCTMAVMHMGAGIMILALPLIDSVNRSLPMRECLHTLKEPMHRKKTFASFWFLETFSSLFAALRPSNEFMKSLSDSNSFELLSCDSCVSIFNGPLVNGISRNVCLTSEVGGGGGVLLVWHSPRAIISQSGVEIFLCFPRPFRSRAFAQTLPRLLHNHRLSAFGIF